MDVTLFLQTTMLMQALVSGLASLLTVYVLLCFYNKYPLALASRLLDLLSLLLALKKRAKKAQKSATTEDPWTVHTDWLARVNASGSAPFMTQILTSTTSTTMTYKQVDTLAIRVANATNTILTTLPPTPNRVIAVMMPSCIEYVACWLGMMKLSVTSGLINTNLAGAPFVHAVVTAVGKEGGLLVVSHKYKAVVEDPKIMKELVKNKVTVVVWDHSTDPDTESSFNKLLSAASSSHVEVPPTTSSTWASDLFYIYTSGTTGLPKASKVNHLRFYSGGMMLSTLCHVTSKDRIYCALPLYHSAGGLVGISACINSGANIILRDKFSVSALADDIIKYRCTVLQYIGEFARFALNGSKDREKDRLCGKTLRVAFGNGMRPEVWTPFQKRFGIGRVVEFYGATEGNANLVNNTGVPGSIGIIPVGLRVIYPVCLAKCDTTTGDLVRDANGLVQMASTDEPGQLLGLIKADDPARRFDGYTDKKASEKKIARDVKKKGDQWFLTGDLLKADWFGFYYWVDRIGDTFRWKGENVSTAEVAAAFGGWGDSSDNVTMLSLVEDANVYGVEIPNQDGRAGMARLELKGGKSVADVDFGQLYCELAEQLPGYARPLFLRINRETRVIEEGEGLTGTFKHKKGAFRDQGYDVAAIEEMDEVAFMRDDKGKTFVQMDKQMQKDLDAGKIRV